MGFIFKAKPGTKSSTENWGVGLLLISFPEDANNGNRKNKNTSIVDQTNILMTPSPSPQSCTSFSPSRIRRTNSSRLFIKAQSTISICALLVFLTLLLFTLSTFEPTIPTPTSIAASVKNPRRFLSQNSTIRNSLHSPYFNFLKIFNTKSYQNTWRNEASSSFALQGMGTLYRRGTRAMADLVVGHVVEDVKDDEFRLFLRVLHRSGITARADIAFLFGSLFSSSKFDSAIREENELFLKLINQYKELNVTRKNSILSFDVTQFAKSGKKEVGEPLWGKRIRGNYSNSTGENDMLSELTQLNYGSIVGFDVTELDPENSLAGFLDYVPMSLRRWACYPMLLGRVRRSFKHIALVDVKHLLLLSYPLSRVKNKSPETVHISMKQDSSSSKHRKRNSDKTHSHHHVNSAIITGGARGVRRLSNAMLTEIVRAAMQHKKKNSVTDCGVLSQLVANEHLLKNIHLITSTESIPETSSLPGLSSKFSDWGVIHRGVNSNHDIDHSTIMKIICSWEVDSSVYKNC